MSLPIARPAAALAMLAALALLAAGCGRNGGASVTFHDTHPLPADTMTVPVATPGVHGGRFVIGETTGPKTFNAIMANETSSTDITDRLFTALAEFDNATEGNVPTLAKSWERAADGLTWTFHLRRGAAFSDGHPITSADVLFSFEVIYDDVLHPAAQDLLVMDGRKWEVSAPDSYTVVIRTPSPNAMVVELVESVRIMPRHVLERAYRSGGFAAAYAVSTPPESLVTSGPWRVREYAAGEKTVLARNPYWFGVDARGSRMPYLDEVVFLIVPDQDALDLKFRSGDVDGLDNPKPENYRWYDEHQKDGNFTLWNLGPSLRTSFFWFNLNRVHKPTRGRRVGDPWVDPVRYAWFSNAVFRRAVSQAIDRDAIVRSVYFGKAVKNWQESTAGNPAWYMPDLPHDDYDPASARRLLASLGFADRNGDGVLEDPQGHPIQFTLKTNSDNRLRVGSATFIKDDLAKVGIRVNVVPVDFNSLITNVREDFDYDAALIGLEAGTPPDPGLGQNVWRSSGRTHYWNTEQPKPETPDEARIDRLMDDLVATSDSTARHRAWREVATIVNRECWIEWLPSLVLELPVRNRFGNLQPSVIPHRLLWNIDRVYVKPTSPGA